MARDYEPSALPWVQLIERLHRARMHT
jgi:hypothetical protein